MKIPAILTQNVQVEVQFEDALKVVANKLGLPSLTDRSSEIDYVIFEEEAISDDDRKYKNITKPGIYSCTDISYHGSPDYQYRFITDDPKKLEAFKCIRTLSNIYSSQIYGGRLN